MTKEIWTAEDELGFQIGDMHGEWQSEESKKEAEVVVVNAENTPKKTIDKVEQK